MSNNRSLQIDVLGPHSQSPNIMECLIYIDGRACRFFTSKSDYEALMEDGVFLRDGKEKDSANVINTTNVFYEKP